MVQSVIGVKLPDLTHWVATAEPFDKFLGFKFFSFLDEALGVDAESLGAYFHLGTVAVPLVVAGIGFDMRMIAFEV